MKNKIVFGKWESVAMLANFMGMQIILGFPRTMTDTAGSAGWMVVVLVSIIAFAVFALTYKLYSSFEGKDLLDISEQAVGGIGRIFTGVIMLVYLISIISIVLREFSEDMKVIILPASPISFVTLFFIVGMVFGAYLGIETIVRFNAIVVPIVLLGFLIVSIGVAPYYDMSNLFPVLGTGIRDIAGKGIFKVSIFSSISLLLFISPFIGNKQSFKKIGYITLVIATLGFLWGTLSYTFVYKYPLTRENFLPMYQMARLINYGRFFQRIESVFVLIWAASALLYLTGGFFFIIHIFRKTFKLKYYRPLILPFAVVIFNLSLLPPNLATAIKLEEAYFRNIVWLITLVMPIIVLATAKIMKKKSRGGGAG